jgi:hypothetical protein
MHPTDAVSERDAERDRDGYAECFVCDYLTGFIVDPDGIRDAERYAQRNRDADRYAQRHA